MNFPAPGAPGPEVVTQESLLLGAAERVGRIRDGRLALHLHLSRLRPQNRQDGHIRIALRMLEPMVNAYRGQMFLLGNADIAFLLKDANSTDVENMIFKLRALFSKDPLTFSDSGDGVDGFCTWYDLEADYDAFLGMARTAANEARRRVREKTAQSAPPQPLDAKGLDRMLERMSAADVSELVRRQAAIVITGQGNAVVLFQEFFVGMSDLQKALYPDVNLLGNRWLFQHLSQTLDQRVLGALHDMKLKARPETFSLNLNISTVLSPLFDRFAQGEKDGTRILVELQVLDVLADSRGFYTARQMLHERGHQVAIDGLNELTLRFMDIAQFDADLYKLTWSPDMREVEHGDTVAAAVQRVDPEKLLLARCDSEKAIAWGLEHGIHRFQGRHVDAMLAAFTMHGCDRASACTLQQCIARHAVIAGPLRRECGNNDMLDGAPVIRAPRVNRPTGPRSDMTAS